MNWLKTMDMMPANNEGLVRSVVVSEYGQSREEQPE